MAGKIIVFEGIDGSGKNLQSSLLLDWCEKNAIKARKISFPAYEKTFFAKEVSTYLNGAFGKLEDIHPKFAALLYAGDRYELKNDIEESLKEGFLLICDRYVPSNLAHQGIRVPKEEKIGFQQWIETLEYTVYGLPRPDLVLFLDMLPVMADQLVAQKEKRVYTDLTKDLHERDRSYLEKVYDEFKSLTAEKGWRSIKCYDDRGQLLPPDKISASVIASVKDTIF